MEAQTVFVVLGTGRDSDWELGDDDSDDVGSWLFSLEGSKTCAMDRISTSSGVA